MMQFTFHIEEETKVSTLVALKNNYLDTAAVTICIILEYNQAALIPNHLM